MFVVVGGGDMVVVVVAVVVVVVAVVVVVVVAGVVLVVSVNAAVMVAAILGSAHDSSKCSRCLWVKGPRLQPLSAKYGHGGERCLSLPVPTSPCVRGDSARAL